MAEKLKLRAVVKFCFLLGKTAGETVVMLEKAYKEVAMGKTQVYDWLLLSEVCFEYQDVFYLPGDKLSCPNAARHTIQLTARCHTHKNTTLQAN